MRFRKFVMSYPPTKQTNRRNKIPNYRDNKI